jgi:hypothetical protein
LHADVPCAGSVACALCPPFQHFVRLTAPFPRGARPGPGGQRAGGAAVTSRAPRRRNASQPAPLAGLAVLDVGCGGGLLAEALARLGADVTGADASAESIGVARAHAAADPELAVAYRAATAEQLVAESARARSSPSCTARAVEPRATRAVLPSACLPVAARARAGPSPAPAAEALRASASAGMQPGRMRADSRCTQSAWVCSSGGALPASCGAIPAEWWPGSRLTGSSSAAQARSLTRWWPPR